MRYNYIIILLLIIGLYSCTKSSHNPSLILYKDSSKDKIEKLDISSFQIRKDYTDTIIPDKFTALKIGYIILSNIYTESQIRQEFPLIVAKDSNKYWTISGTLPEGYDGGVATIKLNMIDGKILTVYHTK